MLRLALHEKAGAADIPDTSAFAGFVCKALAFVLLYSTS
jgi:hypothetical protein